MSATSPLTRIVAVLAAAYVVASVAADPPCFRGLGLQVNDGQEVTVTGISADGTIVVGYKANPVISWRWEAPDGFVAMYGFSGSHSFLDVSDDGLSVVGKMEPYTNGSWDPMRWTAGVGGMWLTALPDWCGIVEGTANAVSADGLTIAGEARSADSMSQYFAFRWDPIGGIQSLGTLPGGDESKAWGISADGTVIVGGSEYEGGDSYQAFRWTKETGLVGLGLLPGGTASYAKAVSADGTTIVGQCSFPGVSEAFRWTEAEGMVGLGMLPECTIAYALDVSADGAVIVGYAYGGPPGRRPLIWDATHGMRDLFQVLGEEYGIDLSDWSAPEASAVSADGTVIGGEGVGPDGRDAWIARLPPISGPTCTGDLDFDGVVDIADLSLLLAGYGEDARGDLDCDFETGLSDLSILLANYGAVCERR